MHDPWEAMQRRNAEVLSRLEDAFLDPDHDDGFEDDEEDEA